MGAMGSRMATSLLKAEHQVTVWNRTLSKTKEVEKAGAQVSETPCAAVQNAEFVISMIRDDEASRLVWLDQKTGAINGLSNKTVAIESSTLSLAWIKELGQKLEQQDIPFLDAPVAGTRPQADGAQLIYFVGGDKANFAKANPILQAMGSSIHHVGETGSGMTIKLGVNSLFAIQASAMAELIGLIGRCGLNENQIIEIFGATPVCSPAAKMLAGAMIAGKFAPLFPLELVEKDMSYAIQAAQTNSAVLPLVEATQKVCATAIKQGYGNDNITGIAKLYT